MLTLHKKIVLHTASVLGVSMRFLPHSFKRGLFAIWHLTSMWLPTKLYIWSFMCACEFFESTMLLGKKSMLINKKILSGQVLRLDLNEKTQRLIYVARAYEEPITKFILRNIKRGDIYVDIGANVGYFTVLCAGLVGESGHIYAFEPSTSNFTALQGNIRQNNLQNVTFQHCAIGSTNGRVMLHINPLNHGGNKISPFSFYKTGSLRYSTEDIGKLFSEDQLQEDVELKTFDDVVKANQHNIAFVKIDVEGHEYEVARGMRQSLLNRRIDRIVCEISNKDTMDRVYDLFEGSGLQAHKLSFKGEPISLQTRILGDILFLRS